MISNALGSTVLKDAELQGVAHLLAKYYEGGM